MSEHFDQKAQAARSQAAQYIVSHSGVDLVIAFEEPIPDEVLQTMLGVLVHEPLQPIGIRYTVLDIDDDGQPTKYDLNDKTILLELIGRSQLIYCSPMPVHDAHDNTRAGIACWAAVRLAKLAPLQWWLKRHPRTPAEVHAYYAVRNELEKLASRHWSRWWYGRRFVEDDGPHGQ